MTKIVLSVSEMIKETIYRRKDGRWEGNAVYLWETKGEKRTHISKTLYRKVVRMPNLRI